MPTNVLLCRWNGGWHEVTNPTSIAAIGRKESLLSLGAQQSVGEVERVAASELAVFAQLREQSTIEHAPMSVAETPYVGYRPADRLTAPDFSGVPQSVRVVSMTVAENVDGVLAFVPIIGDATVDVELDDRVELSARKMVPGTLGGRSKVPSPAAVF